MSGLSMFIPLVKIDAEKRLVYGIATAETKDRSGEVCDYATSKPHYEKWSSDLHAASGGLSKGNLRAMHGKTAAGKLTDITFNDASKQIEICAKVVDDNEWKKVEEGVYTGFSQGGSYARRWTEDGVKKYTAQPNEISLVDLPCLASATFEMVKGEGLSETRHFAEAVTVRPPTNVDVAAKAADLAKAAGNDDFSQFLDAAREELTKAMLPPPPVLEPVDKTEGGVASPETIAKAAASEGEQVWLSKRDGSTHATKADMRRHHAALDARASAQADAAPALDALAGLVKTLAAEPETAEPDSAVEEDWLELAKRGARNSAKDASKIQAMHDHACDLGATCKPDAAKSSGADDLQKRADDLIVERDDALAKHAALKEVVLGAMPTQIAELTKSVEAFRRENAELKKMVANQPTPLHLVGRAVLKVEDGGGKEPLQGDDLEKTLAAMTPEAMALLLTKVAQKMPNRLGA